MNQKRIKLMQLLVVVCVWLSCEASSQLPDADGYVEKSGNVEMPMQAPFELEESPRNSGASASGSDSLSPSQPQDQVPDAPPSKKRKGFFRRKSEPRCPICNMKIKYKKLKNGTVTPLECKHDHTGPCARCGKHCNCGCCGCGCHKGNKMKN